MYLHWSFPLHVFQTHTQAALSAPSRTSTCTHTVPFVLPPPTPQLPPAFFSSVVSQLNSLDSFSGGGLGTTAATLDALDDLRTSGIGGGGGVPNLGLTSTALDALDGLDSLDDFSDPIPNAAAAKSESQTELGAGEKSLDDLLDELDPLDAVSKPAGLRGDVPKLGVKAVDQLDSLDVLDSFPSEEGGVAALPAVSIGLTGLDLLSSFRSAGNYDLLVTYYW